MLLVRKSSWNFVPSLTNLAWMGCCVLLRNGLCACSLLIWPSPFSILRLKSICLPFVRCTLNRFSDPLVDYLRSQRVLCGIKRSLGDAHSLRHPVTDHTVNYLQFFEYEHIRPPVFSPGRTIAGFPQFQNK